MNMSTVTATSKEVVQGYLDALVAGDLDRVRASFAPDATWTIYGDLPIAGPWEGRDAIVDEFLTAVGTTLFEPGSGPSFEFPTLIGEGDTVVVEWRVRARSAATGGEYRNSYCGVFVVADGQIAAIREYLDSDYAKKVLFPNT
jgi:hypothetical protein